MEIVQNEFQDGIRSESLAYWYLRLNGFLSIVNFVVHPEHGSEQRTDADVLGVRFPFRAELFPNTMKDHDPILSEGKPLLIIAEVKCGRCALNGPWTRAEKENVERVLRAVGAFDHDSVIAVAHDLYRTGAHMGDVYDIRLVAFGAERNEDLSARYPDVLQLRWNEVLQFIYMRFRKYRRHKMSHGQWDRDGQYLWDCAADTWTLDGFLEGVTLLHG
jgi:hypothetical protein